MNMTLKQLHEKLGEVIDKCPALAEHTICVADRDADVADLNSDAKEVEAVVIATDGDDFYLVIFHA